MSAAYNCSSGNYSSSARQPSATEPQPDTDGPTAARSSEGVQSQPVGTSELPISPRGRETLRLLNEIFDTRRDGSEEPALAVGQSEEISARRN